MARPELRPVPDHDGADLDALMGRVARGDRAAFERVYDELAATVYGVARRIIRDPERAEDVAQEVFVEVWRKATRFDPQAGTARAWVATVAHRRAVDTVRASQAQRRREDEAGYPEREGTDEGPAEAVVTAEEHGRVRHCLQTLTELQRESVCLAYFNGYTYPEVATLLERSLPTVKTRIRDGLIRLRDCLGGAR